MQDEQNSDGKRQRSLLDEIRQMRTDADKGREPEFLTSRLGTRQYSVAALRERIVDAFIDEHAGGSDALQAADTETKRLKLILATADYALAVESIDITKEDKADLIRRVYNELFTYGPLDELFADEQITTITIEGANKIAVRYGHGDLTPLKPVFEDEGHVRRIIQRLLLDSGAEISEEMPIIEAGLQLNGCPVSVSVVAPPIVYEMSVDIRLHPAQPRTLHDLINDGLLGTEAATLLDAIAKSEHGLVIVGEAESGKTTLLNALLLAAEPTTAATIERTGELRLPHEGIEHLVVRWPMEGRESQTFGDQIAAGLEQEPQLMLLDEVRADETDGIAQILTAENPPRQMWAFRGPADSKRLISALGMLARRSVAPKTDGDRDDAVVYGGDTEAVVRKLYQCLPFVVTMRRRKGQLQLYSIAEWQFPDENAEYPDFVELMAVSWEGVELTGKQPTHKLDLPDNFWQG